ncbi:hypothetical protein COCMIDRAFT_92693 [Bipolaris oryzae ATCC 44560]|uniref:Tat pathway signal sequence n=1 Tax=Bipolaris oryzae ATCC 44560 TaxID=930090 RepID=W6Z3Z9_COCMI|nr:uncharacterized protein COCMIDRAFT_92693 [Bipolaris oryzae ATCC 44560]EUC46487.1 hypothetical protein COCMIDRAFT_92693 [Bipolaris oryzae ATCC 44560]
MPNSDKENDEETAFLHEDEAPQTGRWIAQHSHYRRWYWSTAINLLLLLVFTITNFTIWSRRSPSFWQTDFQDARKAVQYEQQTYTGALTYDMDQRRVIRLHDAKVEYFGLPSPEIEQAWEELLHASDEFPTMSKEEATPFLDDLTPQHKDGEYHFEPDVFHSLHCLNTIRNELQPVLYNISNEHTAHSQTERKIAEKLGDPRWHIKHMEHCLDRIRQALMCHGDLTASPLYSWPGFPLSLGRSGAHTCRKWEPIREWMNERARNGKALNEQ